jgi:diguanylate cyclase (GGDEF)-like protein
MTCDYHPRLVQRMVDETPKTIVGLITLSLLLIWIYYEYVPIEMIMLWIIAQSAFIYLRFLNAKILKAHLKNNDIQKINEHIKYFLAFIIYSAFVWNLGSLGGVYYAPANYEFISITMIMGLISAGTMSLSPIFNVFLVYYFLMLTPQLFMMLKYGETPHIALLVLSFIYIPYIFMLSRSIYKNLLNTIHAKEKLQSSVDELHQKNITDTLTGLRNRRYLFDSVPDIIKISQREDKNISFLMIDVDHFKKINDTYGHRTGDFVLTSLAQEMKSTVRESDILARIGGEEFALLLYNTSNKEAYKIAEKIRLSVDERKLIHNDIEMHVSISIGVSTMSSSVNNLELLYHNSDLNLYKAKESGRNRVC